jgi:hypothetical protein
VNGFGMIDRAVAAIFTDAVEGEILVYDEVSLLFADEEKLVDFQHECYRNGIVHFNSVHRDTMVRTDRQGERFVVRFEFFRLIHRPWRIEAMCIIDGDAPLHEESIATNGNGAPFHLSYKLPTLDSYEEQRNVLHDQGKMTLAAEYENSYGRMSYWSNDGDRGPYIKPRVNLRDTPQ